MPLTDLRSLSSRLSASQGLDERFLADRGVCLALAGLSNGSSLGDRVRELQGRCVLLTTTDQFTTALALIELDGIVRRLVLCPPDLPPEQVSYIIEALSIDGVVSNRNDLLTPSIPCDATLTPCDFDRTPVHQTEWILLTSGTTGQPKMVVHDLATLAVTTAASQARDGRLVWSTFYDIRRYGGLQIFLRAILSDGSLVLSNAGETTPEFLERAASRGVTHVSGTPSHWRKVLMSPAARCIAPQYIRLSGEIADQSILDGLRACYPESRIAHAFASTEAGVAFDVRDGLAGFPVSLTQQSNDGVELKVVDGSLRIRSSRNAKRYIGPESMALTGPDGFVDTRDEVELRGDRYYFVGRRDGVINVGGLKVHPEEVESVINRHQQVRMSLVKMRKNPITGGLVVAEVVLKTPANSPNAQIENEILQLCRGVLPPHKVPAAISFRNDLPVAATGKMVRYRA